MGHQQDRLSLWLAGRPRVEQAMSSYDFAPEHLMNARVRVLEIPMQGVEVLIKETCPEIEEILDVTDHADGKNPYFQGAH